MNLNDWHLFKIICEGSASANPDLPSSRYPPPHAAMPCQSCTKALRCNITHWPSTVSLSHPDRSFNVRPRTVSSLRRIEMRHTIRTCRSCPSNATTLKNFTSAVESPASSTSSLSQGESSISYMRQQSYKTWARRLETALKRCLAIAKGSTASASTINGESALHGQTKAPKTLKLWTTTRETLLYSAFPAWGMDAPTRTTM